MYKNHYCKQSIILKNMYKYPFPRRREWLPTPVLFPGKFHGQRSLVGYSPLGGRESDVTERLTPYTGVSQVVQRVKNPPAKQETQEMWVPSVDHDDPLGGGHDKSFQYSCLGNPMDRGAWWATVLVWQCQT